MTTSLRWAALGLLCLECASPAPPPGKTAASAETHASAESTPWKEPADPPMPEPRTGELAPTEAGAIQPKAIWRHLGPEAETVALDLPTDRVTSQHPVLVALADPAGSLAFAAWQMDQQGGRNWLFVRRPRARAGQPIAGDLWEIRYGEPSQHFRFSVDASAAPVDAAGVAKWATAFAAWLELRRGGPFFAFAQQRLHDVFVPLPKVAGRAQVAVRPELPYRRRTDTLAHVMDTTTGLASLEETLQADRPLLLALSQDKPTIPLDKVPRPALAQHPFRDMLRKLGKPVPAERLAQAAPADFYYVRLADLPTLFRLQDQLDAWVTPIAGLLDGSAEERTISERYQTELGLARGPLSRMLGSQVIAELALVGSDPYIREGSDLTVLFQLKSKPLFDAAVAGTLAGHAAAHGGVATSTVNHGGVAIAIATSPDGAVRQHRASVGSLEVVSNSLGAMRRVLDTIANKAPRLADEPDFQYLLARDAGTRADALAFAGDRFVAEVVGPAQKILESRRQVARAELAAPGYAALLFGWMNGRSPRSVDELVASKLLHKEELRHGAGGAIQWRPGEAARSPWGRMAAMRPLIDAERPDKVSALERDAYAQFIDGYQRYWRQYMDPVGVRVAFPPGGQIAVDLRVLPLIEQSDYRHLTRTVGNARISAGAFASGFRSSLGIGAEAELRRELSHTASRVMADRGIQFDWLGDWAMFGFEDRSPMAAIALHDERKISQRPARADETPQRSGRNAEIEEIFHLPVYGGIAVKSTAGAGLFIAAAKQMVESAAPGILDWADYATHRGAHIVRIRARPDSEEAKKAGDASVFYTLGDGALLVALREGVLRRQIDDRKDGRGHKALEQTSEGAQLIVDLASGQDRPLWKTLAWLLDHEVQEATHRTRHLAELLLRGAPERAGDPAAMRALGLAYLGAVPLTPDGGHYALGKEGVVDPTRGSEHAPRWPALPVAGSAVQKLLDAVAHFRGELGFDDEGPAPPGQGSAPGERMQSLHARVTVDLH